MQSRAICNRINGVGCGRIDSRLSAHSFWHGCAIKKARRAHSRQRFLGRLVVVVMPGWSGLGNLGRLCGVSLRCGCPRWLCITKITQSVFATCSRYFPKKCMISLPQTFLAEFAQ